MSPNLQFGFGIVLILSAILLLWLQQPVWALLPAACAVLTLGRLLRKLL